MRKFYLQAVKFFGLSGIGWLLDFVVYAIIGVYSANLLVNNIISSWAGVTIVFIFATRQVFKNNSKIPLYWKYLIYILYQCILIFAISKLLNIINSLIVENIDWVIVGSFAPIIAKILVTPITMILNFFMMKGIIERL